MNHVGFLRHIVKCDPPMWAEKPIYGVKSAPAEGWTGRREVSVRIWCMGELIWIRADPRDLIMNRAVPQASEWEGKV